MAVDYLYRAVHPITNEVRTFPDIEAEYDSPLERPSGTFAVPGVDGGRDPRGDAPNVAAPRQMTFNFVHIYDRAAGETSTSVFDDFARFFGHGRYMTLYRKDAYGALWINEGKTVKLDDKRNRESAFSLPLGATLQLLNPSWAAQFAPGWARWDAGHTWDEPGLKWDANPDSFALPGQYVTHTVNNVQATTGFMPSAPSYPIITIRGPFPGRLQVINTSIPNAATGGFMYFEWAPPLAATDTLTINAAAATVRLNGQPAWDSRFGRPVGQTEVMRLEPGSNELVIQSVLGGGPYGGSCVVNYTPRKW